MQWDDIGYLVSKNRYNENSVMVEFYTKDHGKCSGVIFGGTSRKIKNYLQIGNKFYINYNYKIEGKLGYFKVEIFKVYTPFYFNNKKKLLCITSAMNLIKLLTVELQENFKIFDAIEDFFINLNNENWTKKYVFWELKILKYIGYDIDFKKIINSEIIKNEKKYYLKSNTNKKYIPNFLIDKDDKRIDNDSLLKGLNLVGDYMNKNILKPNNINYPNARLEFINLFK
jgi:DNA repair protein RecO (recombination protein O)|tara:strand:+ start:205 stop:885 length:681 start_codon:yes stop_codon:yes gene_type:complete